MRLRPFRAVWGLLEATDGILARSPHLSLEELLPALKRQGYYGVEVAHKMVLAVGPEKFKDLLRENGLKCGVIVFTDGPVCPGEVGAFGPAIEGFKPGAQPGDPNRERVTQKHIDTFKEAIDSVDDIFGQVGGEDSLCAFVNSHSARDHFTCGMAETFFKNALEYAPQVMHEGHRKRFLHSPWILRDFIIPNFPELRFVADLSHYTTVAETDPFDPDLNAVIEAVAPMTHHVHCRVGYDHGPQVPDPRADDWIGYTEGFESEFFIARGSIFFLTRIVFSQNGGTSYGRRRKNAVTLSPRLRQSTGRRHTRSQLSEGSLSPTSTMSTTGLPSAGSSDSSNCMERRWRLASSRVKVRGSSQVLDTTIDRSRQLRC